MAALTIANHAKRLAAYAGHTPESASAQTGMLTWIVDALLDAVSQIGNEGGGVFEEPLGSILKAPQTVGVTISASTPTTVTLATAGIVPNDLCTLRIAKMNCDATIKALNGTAAQITPGFDGISTGTFTGTATVWHDAWKISDGSNVRDAGMRVRTKGIPLERVNSRDEAERLYGMDPMLAGPNIGGRRLETRAYDMPRCWWIEHYGSATFLLVYPMPGYLIPIESRVQLGITAIDETNVMSSSETYGLSDDLSRDVLRPLAIESFRNSPFMAAVTLGAETDRQVKRAREILDDIAPKKPGPTNWNMPDARGRGRDY